MHKFIGYLLKNTIFISVLERLRALNATVNVVMIEKITFCMGYAAGRVMSWVFGFIDAYKWANKRQRGLLLLMLFVFILFVVFAFSLLMILMGFLFGFLLLMTFPVFFVIFSASSLPDRPKVSTDRRCWLF